MPRREVGEMDAAKVYSCLVAKVERKGRSGKVVEEAVCRLLGYTPEELHGMLSSGVDYATFFSSAPSFNEKAYGIGGSICGLKLESLSGFEREYRILDKIVDDLAKGRSLDRILPL